MVLKKDARGGSAANWKVLWAIMAGICIGAISAYLRPHSWISSTSSMDKVDDPFVAELERRLKSREDELSTLRLENDRLKSKLEITEQQKVSAQEQLRSTNLQVKPGSVGDVKGTRTNPTVIPDETVNRNLAKMLEKVAINRELIVCLSNRNVITMLKLWSDSIKQAGITNYLVVALDDETAEFCKQNGVPAYRRDSGLQGPGSNHAISGTKFHILREFLVLGYHVLLSDVDIIYLQNPFKFLHRDCDIEAMTDGHSNATAYGYNDVFDDAKMGWSRYAHTMRIWVFNSGFFYLRATVPSIELLDRVATRLAREKAWDQAVINEELFFPSRPGYDGLHASKRVMDRFLFMNSKALFLEVRKDQQFANFKPVTIHVNYHPDKYERMQAVLDYYVNGKKNALARFPDGSQPE